MATTVRAMFINGIFKPLEALSFPEGQEMTIIIDESSTTHKPGAGLEASAGGWKGLIDAEQFKKDIYESRQIQTRPEVKL